MLCLAPTVVWFGGYLRFSGRPELMLCFASAVRRRHLFGGRLRGRFSRVDLCLDSAPSSVRITVATSAVGWCFDSTAAECGIEGRRVGCCCCWMIRFDSMASAEYVFTEDINRRRWEERFRQYKDRTAIILPEHNPTSSLPARHLIATATTMSASASLSSFTGIWKRKTEQDVNYK